MFTAWQATLGQILKLDHKVICNKNNNKFRSISLLLKFHPQTLTRGAKPGSSLPYNTEQMAVWSNSKISIAFKIQSKLQICFKLIFD